MRPTSSWRRVAVAALVPAAIGCQLAAAREHATAAASAERPLVVQGTQIIERTSGRAVTLRGVAVAGNSKVPHANATRRDTFVPFDFVDSSDPDQKKHDPIQVLAAQGFNTIRLLFLWEAYEPTEGATDEDYLASMVAIAKAASDAGIYTVVDFHQDGFSRYVAGHAETVDFHGIHASGCGDGFPKWANTSYHLVDVTPDNGPGCKDWPTYVARDPAMHQSWHELYHGAITFGHEGLVPTVTRTFKVRDAFLNMVENVASSFASVPNVIGYDLLNEPWSGVIDAVGSGTETTELLALYTDEVARIRKADPDSIMFVEGAVWTNTGFDTEMARPSFDNFVYAPHFYDPVTLKTRKKWLGQSLVIDNGFDTMRKRAATWGVPLWVGEFGMHAEAEGAADYMAAVYGQLDREVTSGSQWVYTPGWTPMLRDGWNAEDTSILDDKDQPRPNYEIRPYPTFTAGAPRSLSVTHDGERALVVDYAWDASDADGTTEIVVPQALEAKKVTATGGEASTSCTADGDRVRCHAEEGAASVSIRVER
jgi:endoglycosylceramidase